MTNEQANNAVTLRRNSPTGISHPAVSLHNPNERIVHRLVLTGGPCAGKTTGQAQLCGFFEKLGWKVYRVPEAATILLRSPGIRFADMSTDEVNRFQENLIKIMLALERIYFSLANACKRNCLVICDRGVMDAAAYMTRDAWKQLLARQRWDAIELRDNRYNQVIHLVTAADGAEAAYSTSNNCARTETVAMARELDRRTIEAWVGHPDIDVIDNSTNFDMKIRKMIASICRRIGIAVDAADGAGGGINRKLKFIVQEPLPADDDVYHDYQDFDVEYTYLLSAEGYQCRLRKRGQRGSSSYMYNQRRSDTIEIRRLISGRDYAAMITQRDPRHRVMRQTRRCFLFDGAYYQLDIFRSSAERDDPIRGLVLLETYSTQSGDQIRGRLPTFLRIGNEVSDDPAYRLYNLSLIKK